MNKELLRFATAGSVDDGKSTLIGRLLLETKAIYDDQLAAITESCKRQNKDVDLALLTDGLSSEREQGITIDVAHRYFSTKRRQFIIADSPGHEQYTRNFITAASEASLVVILVDAEKGFSVQTRRHLFVASLLSIPHILVAVNKMDKVGYAKEKFEEIKDAVIGYSAKLNIRDLQFVPVCALKGDMVCTRGENMNWFEGQTFLNYLENVHIASDRNLIDPRFPIQLCLRPHADFRGYAGRVEGGVFKKGEEVLVMPSGQRSRVRGIFDGGKEMDSAYNGQSVVLTFEDEVDASRGDMVVRPGNVPEISNEFEAMIWWMDESSLEVGRPYLVKHTTQQNLGFVEKLHYRIDVNSLHREESAGLGINEVGRVTIKTHVPLLFDPYLQNVNTGNFIIIDKFTNGTVGGGIILQRSNKPTVCEE
ncbi:50S ribosome-binding GTPase [Patescibacteria group bacterium]|nr:50S ribosome-binding GTPase [Patescibacteria group bacterium]